MKISPLNDYAWSVPLTETNPSTGAQTPVITGTLKAFLAATKEAVVAPDALLNCAVNYSSAAGAWVISIDAQVLTKALLDTHFGTTGKAYLIILMDNAFWAYIEIDYEPQAAEMEAA